VDTLGLLPAVVVTAACVQDRDGAMPLLARMRRTCLRIALVWADSAYARRLVSWAAEKLALRLPIVKRTDDMQVLSCCPVGGWSSTRRSSLSYGIVRRYVADRRPRIRAEGGG
jgi:hypothetical protein